MTLTATEIHPRTRRTLNGLFLGLVVAATLFWFWAYLQASGLGADRPQLFNDATTYLAAAERLNAGHELYALSEGDRPVLTIPGVYEAPLLSPPPIAALWVLIAAIPLGLAIWMVAAWAATFAAVGYTVLRAPFPGVPLAFLLSLPLGEQIFGGNACAFYPLFYLLAWRYRDRPWIGVLIAAMAAIKLAPIGMAAWLLGTRRYRAVAVTLLSLATMFLVGGLIAGFNTYPEYLSMLGSVGVSPMSVAGLTGLPWASYALFGLGMAAALAIGPRSSSWSFVVALFASVFGTPALYPGHLASLLALAAPLSDRGRSATDDHDQLEGDLATSAMRWSVRAR